MDELQEKTEERERWSVEEGKKDTEENKSSAKRRQEEQRRCGDGGEY